MSSDVDTLNLLTDKLTDLFNQSQNYYETFLDTNNLYKNGKITDSDFFKKLGDYVVAYSALEFLAIKVIFEIKKTLDKTMSANNTTTNSFANTNNDPRLSYQNQSNQYAQNPQQRLGSAENPVGIPPSVVSTQNTSSSIGTLPSPDQRLISTNSTTKCISCGNELRSNARFCTKCGTKVK